MGTATIVVSSLYYWGDDETSLSKQLYEGGNGIATRVNMNSAASIIGDGAGKSAKHGQRPQKNGEQEEKVVVLALERRTGGDKLRSRENTECKVW